MTSEAGWDVDVAHDGRSSYVDTEVVEVGDPVIDAGSRRVRRGDDEIELSSRGFDVLHLLAVNAGPVVSRRAILDKVWDGGTHLRSSVIDVCLGTIRAKIDQPFGTSTITAVRGVVDRLDRSTESESR